MDNKQTKANIWLRNSIAVFTLATHTVFIYNNNLASPQNVLPLEKLSSMKEVIFWLGFEDLNDLRNWRSGKWSSSFEFKTETKVKLNLFSKLGNPSNSTKAISWMVCWSLLLFSDVFGLAFQPYFFYILIHVFMHVFSHTDVTHYTIKIFSQKYSLWENKSLPIKESPSYSIQPNQGNDKTWLTNVVVNTLHFN